MAEETIERFFCNQCKGKTKHFVRAQHGVVSRDTKSGTSFEERALIIECCGCENLALVKKSHFSEHVGWYEDPVTGREYQEEYWDEAIYPPVSYRPAPPWFDDLPDKTLRDISAEVYKSLQSESYFLAAFGARTLLDRLIVLTVGDQGNFTKGLTKLQSSDMLSAHEREVIGPALEAGHAAAHRGWAPTQDQVAVILDTVEGLIHRLLVLPKLSEELNEAVPGRGKDTGGKTDKKIVTAIQKVEAAPKDVRSVYEKLSQELKSLGSDVTVHPQKHYIAFRRHRNFCSVQVYNQKRIVKAYLNLDPDQIDTDQTLVRDVRQIGHFGTGDLEVTLKTRKDVERVLPLIRESYEQS